MKKVILTALMILVSSIIFSMPNKDASGDTEKSCHDLLYYECLTLPTPGAIMDIACDRRKNSGYPDGCFCILVITNGARIEPIMCIPRDVILKEETKKKNKTMI